MGGVVGVTHSAFRAWGWVAALLFALPACRGVDSAPSTLRLAVRADVTGFLPNPPAANEGFTIDVNWSILEGLVRFDHTMHLQPALAQHWENPDDRTYVFDLRPGLRFSDGRSVTAEDVAASLDAAREQHWITGDSLQAIESVRATGERRVEIRTRIPYLILLYKLPWGLVLPRDSLGERPVPVIGTGPYRLGSWKPGKEFVLERNVYFRGPAPAFERARFQVVPDGDERVSMLLGGQADLIDQVPLHRLDELDARQDVEVLSGPGFRNLFLCLRVDTPPFSDPRVREAVDLAIDRAQLVERALRGRAEPASQLVPSAVVGFDPDIKVTEPDRERSRRLLAEAGYPDGLEVRLDGPNNRYVNDVEILAEVKRQLALVGIDVEVNAQDKQDFFALTVAQRSSFHLLGWACQTGEAGDALDGLLHSPSDGLLGSDNTFGLADPELDRLIEESNASVNLADRTAALQRAIRYVSELNVVVPLVVQTESLAISRRIHWEPPVSFGLRLRDMRPAE